MSNRPNTIQIRLTAREVAMIESLAGKFGDIPKSDVVRRCVADRFKKEFPEYLRNKQSPGIPEEDLTPEQICEMLGGKVSNNESGPVCVGPNGRRGLVVPMTMMGQKGEAGDYRVKR